MVSEQMIRSVSRSLALICSPWLLAVATHVRTADYFAGYAGTKLVPAAVASRWLTWAETDIPGSIQIRAFGVKTLLYSDPNRTMAGDSTFTSDETTFAHDCSGARVMASREGQYLMDPHSLNLRNIWRRGIARYNAEGHFDAIFVDDANTVEYARGRPCNFQPNDWLKATNELQSSLGYPVIYNGLSNFSDRAISLSIGLNASAIGGAMEQCYAGSPSEPKISGDHWYVAEETEVRMAQHGKLFFCYGNDTTDAASAVDGRLYVLASFLLTYDVGTSVLWEYYQGPSHFHVMPESQLVPLRPESEIHSVLDLRTSSGVYQRVYRQCYLAGRPQGACVVAVNPDGTSRALALEGYRRILQISGGGVVDGGTVRVAGSTPPPRLAPLSAVIAFR